MDNRGIDSDLGWVNRKFQELERKLEAMRSERRTAATRIDAGDLTIANGSNILIEDGGGILAAAGGAIRAVFVNRLVQLRSGSLEAAVVFADATPTQSYSLGIAGDGSTNLDSSGDLVLKPVTDVAKINHLTTSASANAVLDATTKALTRSTSSRRYKQDIEDHTIDAAKVLKMRPRTWHDKREMKDNPDCERRYIGFIAEELHDLGLTEFVEYDPDSKADAIAYDRLCVALLALAQSEHEHAKTLGDRVDALTSIVSALVPPTKLPPILKRSL